MTRKTILLPAVLSDQLANSAAQRDIIRGASIHAAIVKIGSLHTDSFAGNIVVNFYAKCERLPEAGRAFDDIRNRDVGSWNCLINANSHSNPCVTFRLFRRMMSDFSVLPNSFTFTGLFKAAAGNDARLGGAKELHGVAVKVGCISGDVFAGTALLNVYCRLGFVRDARKLFDRMRLKNSVSWATMISGYTIENDCHEASKLFRSNLRGTGGSFCVNEFVLTAVVSAVGASEFLVIGEQIHDYTVKNGFLSFVAVNNSIITMYSKCGSLDAAHRCFTESSTIWNSITWGAMITGYVQNGSFASALRMFSEMHHFGVTPTKYTLVCVLNACGDLKSLNSGKQIHCFLLKLGFESHVYIKSALIDTFANCNSVYDAWKAFDQMSEPDTVVWTTMISGYVQNAQNEEALSLYCRMGMEGLLPTDLTLASTLRACSCLGSLGLGKQLHVHTIKHGFNLDNPIGSALMTMYAKSGDIGQSFLIFKKMSTRDVVAWNSMLSAFSQNGLGNHALQLFDEMVENKRIIPNTITFINLLSACSHMGLVDKCWSYFRSMQTNYGLMPTAEHCACMVDTLSRAGLLESAKLFIESPSLVAMEKRHMWCILLGGCMNHRQFELGTYVGEKLMELGTSDSSAYILLSNIYAALGSRNGIERVRRGMMLNGVSKEPGCSWIEIRNRVHVFLVRDQQHPEMTEICEALRTLNKKMKSLKERQERTVDISID